MADRLIGLRANYDDIADVLYLSMGQSTPDRYEEDEAGLIWRLSKDGVRYGVTIVDYLEYWAGRRDQLIAELTTVFHIDWDEASLTLAKVH